jgi:peptide/nickel transport system substrate-binding protein
MSDIDGLVRQYKAGGISRRSFMTRAAAMGLLVPAATGILTAAGPAFAQEPRRGGWLRIAQGNTDDTLEPVRMTDTADGIYGNCVYQRQRWCHPLDLQPARGLDLPQRSGRDGRGRGRKPDAPRG